MISERGAHDIARSKISEMESDAGVSLDVTEMREFAFGWVFFYTSKRFLESEDISDALAGNAPFVVQRETGNVHVFGTAHSFDHYLDEYVRNFGDH